MVMRIATLCTLLAVAAGVSLTHKADVEQVQTTLGQTLLLEMQQKLDAGLPIEELEQVIKDVGDRITKAQAADSKQHDQRQANCTIDKDRYSANIAAAREAIRTTKAAINSAEATYDRLVETAKALEIKIQKLDEQIEEKMNQIESNRAAREQAHESFVNRSTDTTSLLAAIEEIKGVKTGSTLKELFPDADKDHTENVAGIHEATDSKYRTHREGDDKKEDAHDDKVNAVVNDHKNNTHAIHTDDRYHTIDDYRNEKPITANTAFLALSALASKTTDPALQAFLQTAAKASTVLEGQDYEHLQKLFDELVLELKEYTETLIRNEKRAAIDHANTEQSLTEQLRAKQGAKHNAQDTLQDTYRAKREKAQEIVNLRNTLDEEVQKRDDNRQMLADRTAECDLFRKEHGERADQRKEELGTLEQITEILKTKIKSTLAGNDRLNTGKRTTAAPTPSP